MTDAPDYKSTVFLPVTDFPMKAGLAQKEPAIAAKWEAMEKCCFMSVASTSSIIVCACQGGAPSFRRQARRLQQAQRITVILNKPIGHVSHADDDGNYPPAARLITLEHQWFDPRVAGPSPPKSDRPARLDTRGLAPAGRLDIDSTGLLVLTQDGRIARQLIGEVTPVEKEYLVRVDGQLDAAQMALLNHGLSLDGRPLKPARVSWANEDQLRFVLREGRKRQIRRMCDLVGLKVTGLRRVRIGRIPLGGLPVGQWRLLGPFERF